MIVLATGPYALSRLMQADRTTECGSGLAAMRQASSTARATASPPPIHREATPFLPPRA